MRIVTIGGYGFDERRFIEALRAAGVDTFVDVRQRRGLRGKRYAFLNSNRLQQALAAADIRYVYVKALAPTQAVRDVQRQRDEEAGTEKRARTRLSLDFVEAYKAEVLDAFDPEAFKAAVGSEAQVVALFCVEGHPEACHRSLVAEKLGRALGIEVNHVRP